MAIFTNNTFISLEEQAEDMYYDQYPHIMPTTESAYEIAMESSADIYKLVSGLYVADIMIEQSVIREGADADILIENAVTDFADKVVKKFKETWAKISNWFKKIWEDIKVRFTSSKEFVAKYEKKLREKAGKVKDFKPTHHTYNKDVSKVVGGYMAKITKYAKDTEGNKKKVKEDFVENMVKHVKSSATTIAELKSEVQKELEGTESTNAIGATEVGAMIDYCKNINVALKQIEELKKKNSDAIEAAINDIKSHSKDIEFIEAKTRCFNSALSAIQGLNTIAVSAINKINSEYVSILRALMLVKVESAGEELLSESSIFESALNLI